MDQLKAENSRITIDLQTFQQLIDLLLKYRLYLKEYLKDCKCKQKTQSLIRSKSEDLEEEFERLNSSENVVKLNDQFTEENPEQEMDYGIDGIDSDHNSSSFDGSEEISPNVVSIALDEEFVCDQIGCNEKFDSKDELTSHSHNCPKRVIEYMCAECQTSFNDLIKLRAHQRIHRRETAQENSPNKRFACPEVGCNKVFERQSSVNVHISRQHKDRKPKSLFRKSFICDWVGCEQRTTSRQDMDLHIRRKHTLEKPFKCDKCDKSYELEKILRTHQKIHTDIRHECDFEGCHYKTPHKWELKSHIKHKHLNSERFVCDFEGCDRTYKYEGDLHVHKKGHHLNSAKDLVCEWPGCQSKFTRLDTLKNHILRHKNERQFKCEFEGCGKAFNIKKELRNHQTLHEGKMYKYPCEWPGCTKMMATRSNIQVHINRFHLKIKAFKCDECLKTFSSNETLTVHKNRVHSGDSRKNNKKVFKCNECLRVFSAMKTFENHMKSAHSSELLYSCDYPECGQRFRTAHALTYHKSVHTNGGDYKCCAIYCGKSFQTRETLLQHERVHNKQFACSWPGCDKKFARNFLLTYHIKGHQNIREFKCEIEGCGQSFVTKLKLDRHLDRHSNPLPFKCEEEGCERAFTRRSTLQNHLEKVHHATQ